MDNIAVPISEMENNARIKCTAWVPVKNVKVVDTVQQLYEGERVIELGTMPDDLTTIYFYRLKKGDEGGELDRLYPEFHFKSSKILGFEFYLIPKQRMLFLYDPPSSTIIKAPISMAAQKPGPFRG